MRPDRTRPHAPSELDRGCPPAAASPQGDSTGEGVAAEERFDPRRARDRLHALSGQARFSDLLAFVESLPEPWRSHPNILDFAAHARLARRQSRAAALDRVDGRARSADWLDAGAVFDLLERAAAEGRGTSLVRVGDGEARFAIGMTGGARKPVPSVDAEAMATVAVRNWFGGESAFRPADWTRVFTLYRSALATADVIGACGPERMRSDVRHFGYLAWQERWLEDLLDGRRPFWTDALCARELDAASPFLARLLAGREVVGFVSPHAALAGAMQRRLGIGRVVEHVVPGEQRLARLAVGLDARAHQGGVFDVLLRTLRVPHPGCVFLVSAGLLGKIYCARIKELGGVALDIGALSDAWMGFDTRNGHLSSSASLVGPAREPRVNTGCLSIGKTGSMALTAALRGARVPEAFHLHYLGPKALAAKMGSEPMYDVAAHLAAKISDPDQRFRIVTSVRDPVERLLSQAFYRAAKAGGRASEIVRDPAALVRHWQEAGLSDGLDAWFDDTFAATFGFDFREHPFDFTRGSLRFDDGRLRLVVLRLGDALEVREKEVGWLMERECVRIPLHNTAQSEGYGTRYTEFKRLFKAPEQVIGDLYSQETIRHFYSEEERCAMRRRWTVGDHLR